MANSTLMLSSIKYILIITTVVTLAGCAANVKQTTMQSPTEPAAAPRAQAPTGALVTVVTGSAEMQANSDWSDFMEEWQSSMEKSTGNSKMTFVFAKDELSLPANAAVLVRLTVNDFKYVSTTKRIMLGIIAGNAYMDIDAQYLDLPSKKVFGSNKFNTSSSAWEGIFSAVTPKQVQTVSDMIVKEVVANAPEKTTP
jgi:hypothetical protein